MREGRLTPLDEDTQGSLYEATQEVLAAAGLPAYEISNHARPGEESRHNLVYWRYGDYAGIGPGAHGRLTLAKERVGTRTLRQPERWLAVAELDDAGIDAELARDNTATGAEKAALFRVIAETATIDGIGELTSRLEGKDPIARLVARIAVEVLGRRELGRVDEDRHGDPIGHGQRPTHQREMTFVQGSHGGHEAHAQILAAPAANLMAQLGDGMGDLGHGQAGSAGGVTVAR